MAIVKILQYPDPRLKKAGAWVDEVNDEIKQVVDTMFETHYNANNCAALAATQLDFENPYRITVIDFSEKKDQPLCLINPKIVERSGETFTPEGCMSVREAYEKVKRAEKIKVQALDREGQDMEFEADGFMAKCIQHELDHLDGYLFIDRISRIKRMKVDEKIRQLDKKRKK